MTKTNTEQLKYLITYHGLCNKRVAKMIHKSPGTVGQYRCGARNISDLLLEVLEDKCKLLKK